MKTEKILAILIVIVLILNFLNIPRIAPFMVLLLGILTLLYFPASVYFFSDKRIKNQPHALSIISGFFFACIPIGILFKSMYWRGSSANLLVGLVAAVVVLVVVLVLRRRAAPELQTYYKNMLVRTSALAVAAAFFYLVPLSALIQLQYRHDPELARLKVQYYTDRNNEESKRLHDKYVLSKTKADF